MRKGWILYLLILFSMNVLGQRAGGFQIRTLDDLRSFLKVENRGYPLVSAHRGGPSEGYPENALETFMRTAAAGPVIIECDVSLSKDGALVLMHDNTLNRTTTGSGSVAGFSLEELKKLRLKDNSGTVTGFSIPTLEEALRWGKGKVLFTIDVKRNVPYDKIVQTIRHTASEASSIVITYSATQAAEVHRLAPDLMISASVRRMEDIIRLNEAGVPDSCIVAFTGTSAPPDSVFGMLHARGITCILGTMGNIDRMAESRGDSIYYRLIQQGADVLSTDRPEAAGRALRQFIRDQRISSSYIRDYGAGNRNLSDTAQIVVEGRTNSAASMKKPYVILISLDGFRHDYVEKHGAVHIGKLASEGVRAASLIPSFPSLTFPNHYSIATGMYPSRHGITGNGFYDANRKESYSMGNREAVRDSSWYGGTPLWALTEKNRMVSASLFWVGSETAVQGFRPSYSYYFNGRMPVAKRLETLKHWLMLPDSVRPHFITFYLSEPDHAGHKYGPEARETRDAVQMVDAVVHQLDSMVKTTGFPVNFVLVSDHGMTAVDREHYLSVPEIISPEKFIVPASGTMVVVHAKTATDVLPLYKELKKTEKGFKTYLLKDVPAHLHYQAKDAGKGRVGDIVLIPEWPLVFSSRTPGIGHHGFDPHKVKDMHGIFYAWGPAFKKGITVPAFENIHIYPMIAGMLGLPVPDIDGDAKVLAPVLK